MENTKIKKIKIGLWNATGLQNNLDRLLSTMRELHIDVCVVTETWYHQLSTIPSSYVKAVSICPKLAKGRGRNGIAVISVNPEIRIETLKTDNENGLYLWIQINDIKVGAFYLPPDAQRDEELLKLLETQLVAETAGKLIILGDFNARDKDLLLDKRSNARGRKLLEIMSNQNLVHLEPIEGKYTFLAKNQSSIIDLVFTRNVQTHSLIRHENDEVGASSHKLVSFHIDETTNKRQEKVKDPILIRTDLMKTDSRMRAQYIDTVSAAIPGLLATMLDIQDAVKTEANTNEIQRMMNIADYILTETIMETGKCVLGTRKVFNGYSELSSEDLKLFRRTAKHYYKRWYQTRLDIYYDLYTKYNWEYLEELKRLRVEKFSRVFEEN